MTYLKITMARYSGEIYRSGLREKWIDAGCKLWKLSVTSEKWNPPRSTASEKANRTVSNQSHLQAEFIHQFGDGSGCEPVNLEQQGSFTG